MLTDTAASAATTTAATTTEITVNIPFWDAQIDRKFAVAPCDIEPGQIVATHVTVETAMTPPSNNNNNNGDVAGAAVDAPFILSNSRKSFAGLSQQQHQVLTIPLQTHTTGVANVFLANDSLVAARTIGAGETLHIHRATLIPTEFAALPKSQQESLLRYTDMEFRSQLALLEEDRRAVPCTCSKLAIKRFPTMGDGVVAAEAIANGERLFKLTRENAVVLPFPTVYTICVGAGVHMIPEHGSQCIAHGCDPNVRCIIDNVKQTIEFQTIRDIKEGEMVTWNYLTTEWSMDCPFDCCCGAPNCFGRIAGFKHMSYDRQAALFSYASPVVRDLFVAGATNKANASNNNSAADAEDNKKSSNSSEEDNKNKKSNSGVLPFVAPNAFKPGAIVAVDVSAATDGGRRFVRNHTSSFEVVAAAVATAADDDDSETEHTKTAAAAHNAVLIDDVIVAVREISAGGVVLVKQ